MDNPPPRPPRPGGTGDRFADRFAAGTPRTPVLLLAGLVALVFLLLIWLLLLPPFSLLRGSSSTQSAGDGYKVKVESQVPAPPAGLTPATRYYQILSKNAVGAVTISLPLVDSKSANSGMSFYTYQNGKWQQLGPADVGPDGVSAQGQIQDLPSNMIVFKRAQSALQIMGTLPSGKALNKDAAKVITVLDPAGFSPASNGSVTGQASPAVPGAQYDVLPAVEAPAESAAATAVNQILANSDLQSTHVAALVDLANRSGNHGVELDYTAVDPQQRQAFTGFVSNLAQQLHKNQKLLSVALPAPSQSANGWNTGAYDWGQLSKSADFLKLSPDRDQSIYRKQMPDLLKYLTGQAGVDARKLVLVTSPYSEEKSDQGVHALTRLSALSIASQITIPQQNQSSGNDNSTPQSQPQTNQASGTNLTIVATNLDHDSGGSGLIWDTGTGTVSFDYKQGDATHVVWIENEYSEGFKLQFAQTYHLGGIAIDDASDDPALGNVWPAVVQLATTGTPELKQPNPVLLAPSWQIDDKPLDTGGKTAITWQSQPGDHTVSIIVSDGIARVINTTHLNGPQQPNASASVTPTATGSVVVSATPRPGPPTATGTVRPSIPIASPTNTSGR